MSDTMQRINRKVRKLAYGHLKVGYSDYTLYDLEDLDSRYQGMNEQHTALHEGLITELGTTPFRSVLEVACGTGWNIPRFQATHLTYAGLDISETAIAVASLRYPENRYFNMGVHDLALFKDDSFDVIYNSAMLEHIGAYETAINEMIRIARHRVYILFFEGLTEHEHHSIEFHPHTVGLESWQPRNDTAVIEKNIFGRKLLLQDHGEEKRRGWYWNRYSRKRILELFRTSKCSVSVWDKADRPYIRNESVLVIQKPASDASYQERSAAS